MLHWPRLNQTLRTQTSIVIQYQSIRSRVPSLLLVKFLHLLELFFSVSFTTSAERLSASALAHYGDQPGLQFKSIKMRLKRIEFRKGGEKYQWATDSITRLIEDPNWVLYKCYLQLLDSNQRRVMKLINNFVVTWFSLTWIQWMGWKHDTLLLTLQRTGFKTLPLNCGSWNIKISLH